MIKYITKKGEEIIIDDEYSHLAKLSWQVNNSGYARRTVREKSTGKYKTLYMHRLIGKPSESSTIDHINNNKLDNRVSNLRVCSQSDNLKNRSKKENATSIYFGVSKNIELRWKTKNVSWQVNYKVNGKRHTKRYATELEAATVREQLIKENNDTYSRLNFE